MNKYLRAIVYLYILIIFVPMLSGNTLEQNQNTIYNKFSNPSELKDFIDSQLAIFNKAADKIRELEKNPLQKDEFETTNSYEARMEKEKLPSIKIIKEVMDSNKRYLATNLFPVELGQYNADSQVFSHLSYEGPISYFIENIKYPITRARELRELSTYLRFEAIFSMLFWKEIESNWFAGKDYSKYHWYYQFEKIKFYREDTNEIIIEKTFDVKK